MRIAVFEDDHGWRRNVAFLLELDGHKVETFETIDKKDPQCFFGYDLVIADNLFEDSEITGYDFLARLRDAGFRGKLLLYSNSPFDGEPWRGPASDIVVATKDQHIDAVVGSL